VVAVNKKQQRHLSEICRCGEVGYLIRLASIFTAFLCACFSATVHAQDALERPARPAQCYLEVNNVYYFGGDCLFAPLDKVGSFRITGDKGLSAQVKVKDASHITTPGIGSWSGPNGGDAAAVNIGRIYNNGRGCWRVDDHDHPYNRISICAWDSNKNQRLYLGPMMDEDPHWSLLWGQNTGEWARIISSTGLDTEHASVVAEKSRDGAIHACRDVEGDWSTKCINQIIETGPAPAKSTLRGDCTTKAYTDFLGRNLKRLETDILDVDKNSKLGFAPPLNDWDVARTAFEALCPSQIHPPRQSGIFPIPPAGNATVNQQHEPLPKCSLSAGIPGITCSN
jgi:hypothetical protein